MSQHASLTPERWQSFTRDQQLMMIANEMNRCQKLLSPGDRARLQNGLERVLRLTDLTAQVNAVPALRRELLRWREVMAQFFLDAAPDPDGFRAAFRALLLLTPALHEQIPFVLGPPPPPLRQL